jgi:RNA polymerase sigma factor (sigma-70 family)
MFGATYIHLISSKFRMNQAELDKTINDCKKGKAKARKLLYEQYHRLLLGICVRYSRDKSEAEDILLDGFMQIFQKIESYAFEGSFEGWMKRIIVHTAIDHFRKNKKENFHLDIDDFQQTASNTTDVLKKMAADDILKIIQQLPPGYRLTFNLFAIEGYSHKEIAERLNISESTSKSQVRKARLCLIGKLKNTYD